MIWRIQAAIIAASKQLKTLGLLCSPGHIKISENENSDLGARHVALSMIGHRMAVFDYSYVLAVKRKKKCRKTKAEEKNFKKKYLQETLIRKANPNLLVRIKLLLL
jgi:hypothetical protein